MSRCTPHTARRTGYSSMASTHCQLRKDDLLSTRYGPRNVLHLHAGRGSFTALFTTVLRCAMLCDTRTWRSG